MSAIKEVYDLVKELMTIASKAKNQEVVNLAMNLQSAIFDLREQQEQDKQEIKALQDRIDSLLKANVLEEKVEYSPKGFFTISGEEPKLPYCSHCWKTEKRLVPLAQFRNWCNYRCPSCKAEIVVMNAQGEDINKK